MADTREIMERFFAEAINRRDTSRLGEFCSEEYVWHGTDNSEGLGDAIGFNEYREVCDAFFEAFPDFHVDIDEIIVEGNRAVVRYNEGGTHSKDFAGFPASGKLVRWSGIGIFHLENGKIREEWLHSNMEDHLRDASQ